MIESTSAVAFAVAIPTLVGSLLSVVGTGFIIATYVLMPRESSHIRHALIFNLAVAGMHYNTSI